MVKRQAITKLSRLGKFKRQKNPNKQHPHRHTQIPTDTRTLPSDPHPGKKKADRWMTVRRVTTGQEDENSLHVNQKLACF